MLYSDLKMTIIAFLGCFVRVWQANGWMCTIHLTKVANIRKYVRNQHSDFDLNLFSTIAYDTKFSESSFLNMAMLTKMTAFKFIFHVILNILNILFLL